ncbi:MAG: single-stranded DNA-binding protein [Chloroflexota bacterium]
MYSKFTLVGRLGQEPQMRYTSNGIPVTNFSIAVNSSWTDSDGQHQEETTWFKVTCWRKQAEICSQYLKKGSQVLVEGANMSVEAWIDAEKNAQASMVLTPRRVIFLSPKGEDVEATADEELWEATE